MSSVREKNPSYDSSYTNDVLTREEVFRSSTKIQRTPPRFTHARDARSFNTAGTKASFERELVFERNDKILRSSIPAESSSDNTKKAYVSGRVDATIEPSSNSKRRRTVEKVPKEDSSTSPTFKTDSIKVLSKSETADDRPANEEINMSSGIASAPGSTADKTIPRRQKIKFSKNCNSAPISNTTSEYVRCQNSYLRNSFVPQQSAEYSATPELKMSKKKVKYHAGNDSNDTLNQITSVTDESIKERGLKSKKKDSLCSEGNDQQMFSSDQYLYRTKTIDAMGTDTGNRSSSVESSLLNRTAGVSENRAEFYPLCHDTASSSPTVHPQSAPVSHGTELQNETTLNNINDNVAYEDENVEKLLRETLEKCNKECEMDYLRMKNRELEIESVYQQAKIYALMETENSYRTALQRTKKEVPLLIQHMKDILLCSVEHVRILENDLCDKVKAKRHAAASSSIFNQKIKMLEEAVAALQQDKKQLETKMEEETEAFNKKLLGEREEMLASFNREKSRNSRSYSNSLEKNKKKLVDLGQRFHSSIEVARLMTALINDMVTTYSSQLADFKRDIAEKLPILLRKSRKRLKTADVVESCLPSLEIPSIVEKSYADQKVLSPTKPAKIKRVAAAGRKCKQKKRTADTQVVTRSRKKKKSLIDSGSNNRTVDEAALQPSGNSNVDHSIKHVDTAGVGLAVSEEIHFDTLAIPSLNDEEELDKVSKVGAKSSSTIIDFDKYVTETLPVRENVLDNTRSNVHRNIFDNTYVESVAAEFVAPDVDSYLQHSNMTSRHQMKSNGTRFMNSSHNSNGEKDRPSEKVETDIVIPVPLESSSKRTQPSVSSYVEEQVKEKANRRDFGAGTVTAIDIPSTSDTFSLRSKGMKRKESMGSVGRESASRLSLSLHDKKRAVGAKNGSLLGTLLSKKSGFRVPKLKSVSTSTANKK